MLLSIIRKNQKLAAKRHPMFEKNRFAKFLIYFMVAYWAALLLFMGVMLPFGFEESFSAMEPYHILNQALVYLLAGDFLLRFMFQNVDSQDIKPYLLMPVKRKSIINALLIQSGLSSYNFFWYCFFAPFAFITVIKFYGFMGVVYYLLGIWLLMVLNNYWYLFCRMLLNEKWYYLIVPAAFYGLLAVAEFVPGNNPVSTFTMNMGEGFIEGNALYYLGVIALIGVMFLVDRWLHLRLLYNEISKVEDTKIKHLSEYKFLDRYGNVGEYLRLELKLLMRNKVPRTQFRLGIIIMLGFSAALAFSEVYDGSFMMRFICIYNFAVLGVMTLSQVMAVEGNYIDGLMSRKESIFNLLRAKYYLNCLLLLVPFLLMMVPVAKGKISMLMAVSYLCFSAGFVFAMILQLAVYNKKTVQLNTKVMGKNQGGTFFQSLITSGAFFLPILIDRVLSLLFSEDTTLIIMMVMGLALVATHTLWLKNIYNRFMKRRYANMEGFRDSR